MAGDGGGAGREGSIRELILIRHAATEPDWGVPAWEWRLSDAGAAQARKLAGAEFWPRVELLYSSDEPKAMDTARPAARRQGLVLRPLTRLREVRRPKDRLENYAAAVQAYLSGRGERYGWESLESAERRIWMSVGRVLRAHPGRNVAIVSHGLVLTLYACRLLDLADRYGFWKGIPFAGHARVDADSAVLLKGFC